MTPTLGNTIHRARLAKKWSLRRCASTLEISPSYLHDIENDRRVPSDHRLEVIAFLLDLDLDHLRILGGRWFGDAERCYLARRPLAGRLVRRIAELNLNERELALLVRKVEGMARVRP